MRQVLHVLFICEHNATRSLMAEALLTQLGEGRFKAFSAGRKPNPQEAIDPTAAFALREAGILVDNLYSKGVELFDTPDSPVMDLIISLDQVSGSDATPYWPGLPAKAHWPIPEPLPRSAELKEKLDSMRDTLFNLHRKIEQLVALPEDQLQGSRLQDSAKQLAHV